MTDSSFNETTLNGPALCFSNHKSNGTTVLRTGKVYTAKDSFNVMWTYGKLAYNTKYPWEALPNNDTPGIGAQQYVIRDLTSGEYSYGNTTFWCYKKDDILYRRQVFGFDTYGKPYLKQMIYLADFPVSYGIMRVDRHKLYRRPVEITLGSFGFPDNGTTIEEKNCGQAKAVILKGTDFSGNKKQMAMTIYDGWKSLSYLRSSNTNPDSTNSIIIYAQTDFKKQYGAKEPYILISQVLTKESFEDFSENDLFPISSIVYEDTFKTGAYGNIFLNFKSGLVRKINFEGVEEAL